MQIDGTSASAESLSIDDVLDQMEAAPATTSEEESEAQEPEQEPEQVEAEAETEEVEEEAEAEPEEQDESEAEDAEPVEVYDAEEYGEITIALKDGTQTTLADIVAGNLRRKDYSRKTEEVAEARKALEAKAQELAERERQLAEKYATAEDVEPDWAKEAEEDPLGWQLKKIQWDKSQAEKAKVRQEQTAKQQADMQKFRQHTMNVALEKVPEWNNAETFKEGAGARHQTALDAGFSDVEYNNAVDFRFAVLLEWAAKGRAAENKVKTVQKKLSKVPKVIKPGTSTTKAEQLQAEATAKKNRRNRPMTINEHLDTFYLKTR